MADSLRIFLLFLGILVPCAFAEEPATILNLPGSGTNPEQIDYDTLPVLKGEHRVIHPAQPSPDVEPGEKLELNRLRLQLHNYLLHHGGKYWCIWSDGPRIEDWPTQEIKYSTSSDGLNWSVAESLTGTPEEPYAYIARGLWFRQGKLLALAARYKGKGAFGSDKELRLLAFRWVPETGEWVEEGLVYHNAINNFPPQKLSGGDWILTRRDARFNVSVLIGGREALDDWRDYPVVDVKGVPGFRPDEPIFWPLSGGGILNALFRDNGGSQRLFHATSADEGKSWSAPVLSNFPNATSKIFSLETSRGYRVLVSNANPTVARRELHLSISKDGEQFIRMARLEVPTPPVVSGMESLWKKFNAGIASLQYPHAMEKDGYLWIVLSRNKVQTEIFRVSLESVETVLR